jgi:hypothetical protein
VAWNALRPSSIPVYVAAELAMAKYMREHPLAVKLWDRNPSLKRLVISPALLQAYVRSSGTGCPLAYYDQLTCAAALLAAGVGCADMLGAREPIDVLVLHLFYYIS